MVFARNAFASGPGTARNSIGFTSICRKVKMAFILIDKNPADELIRGRLIGIFPIS
jgi:hypothetical protein